MTTYEIRPEAGTVSNGHRASQPRPHTFYAIHDAETGAKVMTSWDRKRAIADVKRLVACGGYDNLPEVIELRRVKALKLARREELRKLGYDF